MPAYPHERRDPYWVNTEGQTTVLVAMNPVHADAYQRWLKANGLHLASEGDVYIVGVRNNDTRFHQRSRPYRKRDQE